MLNGFSLIWLFILKKSTTAPCGSWNFFVFVSNFPQSVSKEAQFWAGFKKVNDIKTDFLETWNSSFQNHCKIRDCSILQNLIFSYVHVNF